eukprot:TRINITY_DN46247_c0_g1_i1.p1 TRINITY_DN46247_c0_g1~~TRINITY_DN46247_c0_g1_i1.p1  ORF type:complete len:392 (+),score=48.02 TRINITY_DN46247_c0_g1_i1:106-1281(+)
MAHFFKLQSRLDEIMAQYFLDTQAASDNLSKEMSAIIKCQSVYRASKVRERYHSVQYATRLIQRIVRGMLARIRTREMRRQRIRRMNMVFFHHCAAVIQKYFRGWWSRRHLHNYYGRKAYLATVAKRGEWTCKHLTREYAVKLQEAKVAEELNMKQEFNTLAGELHHLVSTKTIPGVYNPPYNDALPRAFEKPIEQHLRDNMQVRIPRSLRRPRHRSVQASATPRIGALGPSQNERIGAVGDMKGPPQDLPDRHPHYSRTASVGRMQKIQGPFRSKEQIEVANAKAANIHRTIQQSGPHGAVEADRSMQQRLEKLTRVSPIDFMAPGLPPIHPAPTSVHTAIPYRERPVELRNDYLELPKIRDKPPFFTALPMDKHFDEYNERHYVGHGAV